MDATESVAGHKLKDITDCYLCKETMKNPKLLPCIHTFCLECLQKTDATKKISPGDAMPCPICRKEFTIPQKGFVGLKKNLFIERLVKNNALSLMAPFSFGSLCHACLEPGISYAEMYCRDCDEKFCADCSASHRVQNALRKHELFALRVEEVTSQNLQEIVVSFCEIHEEEQLSMYCTDCDETICLLCFQESHQNHRLADISLVADNFREQIQNNISYQLGYETGVLKKKQRLDKDKDAFLRTIEFLESAVNEARDEVIQIVEKQADSLIEKIDALRKIRISDFEAEMEYYDRYETSLESFKDYCRNLITIGSSSDVCWVTNDINTRGNELDEEYVSLNGRTLPSFPVYFKKSEMKENIVGLIKDERHYITEPDLSLNLRVKVAEDTERRKPISGLAVLHEELFFTRRRSSTVQIIDLRKNVLFQWKLDYLRDPRDLISCERNRCLYIIDWKYKGNFNVIFRVDTNGKLIKNWSIGSQYGRISVTNESNVLLAVHSEMKLNEYTPDGQLIREIELTESIDAKHPWHAVSLPNGHFLVGLHAKGERQHRICTVDHNGDVVRSTGQMEQIDVPVCLTFDGDGSFIVADKFKNRLLLYDLNLELKKELITETDGLLDLPLISFSLHESTGQLFVTFSDEDVNNIIQVFSIWN